MIANAWARGRFAASFLVSRWERLGPYGSREGMPPVHYTPTLAAHFALDEAILTGVALYTGLAPRDERRRVIREVVDGAEVFRERGWVDDPSSYHRTPPSLPGVRLRRSWVLGQRFHHLTFPSGYEPHESEPGRDRWLSHRENRTAHAWVLEHEGPPRPWIVCVHAYRLGPAFLTMQAFRASWLHCRLGLNVVLPVLPFHGPRASAGAGSGDGFLAGDYLDTLHAMAQTMWDLRRLLGWLREHRGAPGTGVHGISLGGYSAALLASLDSELSFVVAGVPATDFIRLEREHAPAMAHTIEDSMNLVWDDAEEMLRVVSPLALQPRVAPERRFLYAGLVDRMIPPDHVHRLWLHWGRPRIAWYPGGHLTFRWQGMIARLLREAMHQASFAVAPA